MRRPLGQHAIYAGVLAVSFALALIVSWTGFGMQLDNDAYDWMFRMYRPQPWQAESMLLSIDEETLDAYGGMRGIRKPLADGLEMVAAAGPKAVAVDLILADHGDPATDAKLAEAFRATPKLILGCELIQNGKVWEDPIPRFRQFAAAVGHLYAQPNELDSVTRAIPLEKANDRQRRWALSLEAYRVSRGVTILESPDELQVGNLTIPAPRRNGRLMRIRYMPVEMGSLPRVSLKDLNANPSLASRFHGKVVFVGVTAQAAGDRQMTPYSAGRMVPGVEIHANAFETIAQGLFLTDAPAWQVVAWSGLLVILAGLLYALLQGWQANAMAVMILLAANAIPYLYFTHRLVFSYITPVTCAWFSIVFAAAWQHLVVRRSLQKAEADRARYQKTIHFVTHEMRTPLTAIQGSSELMTRYALTDEKRKQIAQLINNESKRLGRMINMFLSVERLSAGEVELKKERFSAGELMATCIDRVRPVADGKQIRVTMKPLTDDSVVGDRELLEYAFYNLLTNAVKYSPQQTEVTVFGCRQHGRLRISVQDQGIGMDQKEIRNIFQKFYRTRKAEESGEAGTGIGLSIVEQIIAQHGGTIEVTSEPGRGSCFTLVLPAPIATPLQGVNATEQH